MKYELLAMPAVLLNIKSLQVMEMEHNSCECMATGPYQPYVVSQLTFVQKRMVQAVELLMVPLAEFTHMKIIRSL